MQHYLAHVLLLLPRDLQLFKFWNHLIPQAMAGNEMMVHAFLCLSTRNISPDLSLAPVRDRHLDHRAEALRMLATAIQEFSPNGADADADAVLATSFLLAQSAATVEEHNHYLRGMVTVVEATVKQRRLTSGDNENPATRGSCLRDYLHGPPLKSSKPRHGTGSSSSNGGNDSAVLFAVISQVSKLLHPSSELAPGERIFAVAFKGLLDDLRGALPLDTPAAQRFYYEVARWYWQVNPALVARMHTHADAGRLHKLFFFTLTRIEDLCLRTLRLPHYFRCTEYTREDGSPKTFSFV